MEREVPLSTPGSSVVALPCHVLKQGSGNRRVQVCVNTRLAASELSVSGQLSEPQTWEEYCPPTHLSLGR